MMSVLFIFSRKGVCGWFDFAKAIFAFERMNVYLNPIQGLQYNTPASRIFYVLLNKSKIKKVCKLEMPYWK